MLTTFARLYSDRVRTANKSVSSRGNGIAKWEATKQDNVSRAPFGTIGPKGFKAFDSERQPAL